MKYAIVIIIIGLAGAAFGQDWQVMWNRSGATWKEKWNNTLDRIEISPDKDKFEILGAAVRLKSEEGGRRLPTKDQLAIGNRAAEALINIPGHARYFANQLVAARRKTEKPWLDNDYQTIHHRILEIMVHLPSPETVWVLGGMLESEEDLWTREERVAIWREQGSKGFESSIIPSPRGFAGGVLQKIGLREYPAYPSHKWKEAPLPWWQEVKSGKRTISFKGQSVEYRFKPDGTWDTIAIANPPDDGPKPQAVNADGQSDPNPVEASPPERPERSGLWVWILIGMIGGLAGVFWIGLRKSGS